MLHILIIQISIEKRDNIATPTMMRNFNKKIYPRGQEGNVYTIFIHGCFMCLYIIN